MTFFCPTTAKQYFPAYMSWKQRHPHNYSFFIPVFYTLSRWLQLFYHPQAAVQVVTQTYTCSSQATPRQEAWLVFPTGDSHFPSTAFKVQLPAKPICAYFLPVVSLNMFLCRITSIGKHAYLNIHMMTYMCKHTYKIPWPRAV